MSGSKAVFFAADAVYLPLAWVAARSVAAEPARDFDVWLLVDKKLEATVPPPGVFLRGIALPELFLAASGPAHMSAFSYARLLAADDWLRDYDRLLYIDSDTRIAGALAPLFQLELGNAIAAMTEDCGRYLGNAGGRENWDAYRAVTGLPDAPYFNAGVMLLDAARWRQEALGQRAETMVRTRGPALRFMDQDVLNVLLAGRIAELSPRWNFMTHYMALGLEDVVRPRILHYANVLKPWRDPEWATLYGRRDATAFARLFEDSPWPGFVHKGLGSALPWRKQAALRAAQAARHVPEAALAGHVANFTAMAPRLRREMRAGFAEGAARYVDLTPAERGSWAALD
ncbi:MAG: glycosyltransferase family 8 protein [Rhodospirillales bacterium]|nr:glycosyltransferase family 8 protein [Rhodospirillales bacterium]